MSVTADSRTIEKVLTSEALHKAGIVGVPPLDIISKLNQKQVEILDLDAMLVMEDMESTVTLLPRVYCAILRTVVLNAMHLDLDVLFIDVGPGKCDAAFHVATILEEELKIPVIKCINNDKKSFGTPLCSARMDLMDKFVAITEGVKRSAPGESLPPCEPTAGFWGVPPRDFNILSPFPDTTHVFGWSRCMENKTPSDTELEALINPDIPTVFFAQSFCAKTALARHLAKRHPRSLYLDINVTTGSSTMAKIQAFLELSGVT